ncbi:glycosyltransferase [Pedobacter sp. SD-b]|uniref:Glycosyltransferase n=1 Tax=Pedobacter segetis TaxID=2793069 RepID=A0ABS1BHQ1_9SPHI|nr:glycosyltransferase [Pedobacter segetis]
MDIYISYALFFLFQICFIIQLYYLLVIQRKFSVFKPNKNLETNYSQPVSVIICARNEAENLKNYLPFILEQNHPNFEVIVVNDCSYDNSEDVLKDFAIKYKHLKVVKIEEHPRFKTAKKFAATLGIKAAIHDIILFTDADCKPGSENWINRITAHYQNDKTEIVLGYSPYIKGKGFLNRLIRYETYQTALNYFAYSLNAMPYMGVGRNLSYKKSLFFKNKGFASHMHIPSGDDDLFVNQNANAHNTEIEFSEDSQVWSEPKTTWKSYWKQKSRHLGAGKAYKNQDRKNLGLQFGSAIGFYALLVLCLFFRIEPLLIAIIFLIRFVVQIYVFYQPFIKLRNKDLIWWFIILDPFYYIYLTSLGITGVFRKKTAWK